MQACHLTSMSCSKGIQHVVNKDMEAKKATGASFALMLGPERSQEAVLSNQG